MAYTVGLSKRIYFFIMRSLLYVWRAQALL
nr:MAG TPA: hypothetical protein [Caudoviricetes sp.]